jgi:hypothetical protein
MLRREVVNFIVMMRFGWFERGWLVRCPNLWLLLEDQGDMNERTFGRLERSGSKEQVIKPSLYTKHTIVRRFSILRLPHFSRPLAANPADKSKLLIAVARLPFRKCTLRT